VSHGLATVAVGTVHTKKEVRKALKELTAAGWTIEVAAGGHAHRWGPRHARTSILTARVGCHAA